MLLVDGHPLLPHITGTTLHFNLPPNTHDIRLSSRAATPAHREISSNDHRQLGVAVARITADGQTIHLDDPKLTTGWHQPEPGWRWTNGEATITANNTKTLEIQLALTTTYWTTQPTRTARAA